MADVTHARGRPASWVAVLVIVAGFVIGGLGLVLGPTWWLFWAGAGIAALGGIIALVTDIFADVTVDPAHGPAPVTRRGQGHGSTHASSQPSAPAEAAAESRSDARSTSDARSA
jgi:hypothetical protein